MRNLFQDIRFAFRILAKSGGFTAIAVTTVALGICANTTIFSWITSTLLNPIPGVVNTSHMVTVMKGERSEHPTPPFSFPDYQDLRESNRSFAGLLAWHHDYMSLTGGGKPDRIYGALTSGNYFDVLGIRPVLGRVFQPSDEVKREGAAVAVLGYGLWESHFGGDASIIGKTIQINRHPYEVIGVAPPGFQGCMPGLRADVWIPWGMVHAVWGFNGPYDRGNTWLNVLGKLKEGVDRHQAERELDLLMQRIAQSFPDTHRGPNQITLDPMWRSPFGANVYLYSTLPKLLALAAVLLLLACANVANLLLVRSIARRREIAIRLSVGASRWRLVRQLLVESLILALAAGTLATLLTTWTAGTFAAFVPSSTLPLALNGHMDRRVMLAALLVSLLTAVVFGALPAVRASSMAPSTVLKEEAGSVMGGLHKSRLASALVVAQIALSLLLLICAGLFTRSLRNSQQLDPGFNPEHVLLFSYELGPSGYSEAQAEEFDRQLIPKLEALPGAVSATIADFSPLNFSLHSDGVFPEGYLPRLHESLEIDRADVGPNYFQTMRTPLIEGRDFTMDDTAKSQLVAIVNQAFVARYWPGQEALGKRVQMDDRWFTVVGVAHNGKYRRLIYRAEPGIFLPLFQHYGSLGLAFIHTRVVGDPLTYASLVQTTVHEMNPDLPVFNVTTLRSSMRLSTIFERVAVTFAGSSGLLALVLAGVGIYGVVAYSTRQRTHEIGLRMALGAQRGDILRLVLSHGLRLVVAGLAVGLAVSFAVTPVLKSLLLDVPVTDSLTYAGVSLVLCAVALLACYIPARRATKVEPMEALRCE
jgi:putative ABC transport system permease protein